MRMQEEDKIELEDKERAKKLLENLKLDNLQHYLLHCDDEDHPMDDPSFIFQNADKKVMTPLQMIYSTVKYSCLEPPVRPQPNKTIMLQATGVDR